MKKFISFLLVVVMSFSLLGSMTIMSNESDTTHDVEQETTQDIEEILATAELASMPPIDANVAIDIAFSTKKVYNEPNSLLEAEVTAENTTGAPLKLTAIMAFYEPNGKLADIKTNSATIAHNNTAHITVSNDTSLVPSGGYAKIMVWDMDKLRPYSESVTLTESEINLYNSATLINANSTTPGYLKTEYQIDWYRINEKSSGLLSLALNNIPAGCSYRVAICDTTGNVIMDDTVSGASRTISGFSILKNQDYYIIVYSSAGSSKTQAYTLTSSYVNVADKEPSDDSYIGSPQGVAELSAYGAESDEAEPSPSYHSAPQESEIDAIEHAEQATAMLLSDGLVLGTPVTIPINSSTTLSGHVPSNGGITIYNTTLNAGDKLVADLTSPSGKTYIAGIASSDLHVFDMGVQESSRSHASWKATTAGTYHIMVYDYYESGVSTQPYSLRVYRYNSSNYDAWEINDTHAQTSATLASFNNALGSSTKKVSGISNLSIDTRVDQDKFPVYLNAGDKLTADINMGSGYNDNLHKYRISIEWTDESSLNMYTYDNPGSLTHKKATFIAPVSRQYYVSIASDDMTNGSPSIKYTLTVTKAAAADVDQYESSTLPGTNDFINKTYDITSRTQLTATLDNQLDVDWYKIYDTGSARTKIIELKNCDANTQMELYEVKNGVSGYIPCEAGGKKIIANIDRNTEYRLWVGSTNWNPNNKGYTLELTNTRNTDALSLTNTPSYNGGAGAKVGNNNTLSFNMKKQTSGSGSYWIEAAAAWGANGEIWGKSESGKTVTFSGTADMPITLNNLAISNIGDDLQTYIRAYVSDADRTLVFASPPFGGNVGALELVPQTVVFNQQPHGIPYKYIYVDHPEHIRTIDTVEAGAALMHTDLQPGIRYVLAEYHHKSTWSGYGSDPFDAATALYYDAAFCGNQNTNITIHRIGYSHSNWGYLDNAYTDFLGMSPKGNRTSPHSYNSGTYTFPAPAAGDTKGVVWFSEFINSSDPNKMVIAASGDAMGYVHVLVEFEVSAPATLRTLAYTNQSTYKATFKSSMQSTYEDLPEQVSKGVGNFAQTIDAGVLEYSIDDSLFTNKQSINLPFKISNKFNSDSVTDVLYTNSVPAFYDAQGTMPESGVFSITYTGGLKKAGGGVSQGSMTFDGYHNPRIGSYEIPGVHTLGQNEAYPQSFLNWIKNDMDNRWGTNPSAAAIAADALFGASSMGGYDVTHKYKIRINNMGSQTRYLTYSILGSNEYIAQFGTVDTIYKDDHGKTVSERMALPPGITEFELCVSMIMGGNATAKQELVVMKQ